MKVVNWFCAEWCVVRREKRVQMLKYKIKGDSPGNVCRAFPNRTRQICSRKIVLEPPNKFEEKFVLCAKIEHIKVLAFFDFMHGWIYVGSALVRSAIGFDHGSCWAAGGCSFTLVH